MLKLTLVFFGEDLWDGGWAERLLVACKLIGKLVSVCFTVGVGDFLFRVSDQDFALVLRDVVQGYELLEPDGFLVGQGGCLHLVGIFCAYVIENEVALAVRLAVLHLLLDGGDGVQLGCKNTWAMVVTIGARRMEQGARGLRGGNAFFMRL